MVPNIVKFAGGVIGTIALLIVLKLHTGDSAVVVAGIVALWGAQGIGHSLERAAKIRGGTGHAANVVPPSTTPESVPPAHKKAKP